MTQSPPYIEILDIRGSKVLQMIDPSDNVKARYQYLVEKFDQDDKYPRVFKRRLPNVEFGDVWRDDTQPAVWEQVERNVFSQMLVTRGPVIEYMEWCPPGNTRSCVGGPMEDAEGKPIAQHGEQNYGGNGPEPIITYPMRRVQKYEYWPSVTDVACPCCAGGTVRWFEAGYVPGYRICDKCHQHFLADGNMDAPTLIAMVGRVGLPL